MFLTDAQLHDIREVIKNHHNALVVNLLGPKAVDPQVLDELRAAGLLEPGAANLTEEAYLYGQLLALQQDPATAGMTYEQFREYVRKRGIPLTDIEQRAADWAAHSAAQYIVGLGNRVNLATGAIMIEADAGLRDQMRSTIRDKVSNTLARRETAQKLKSDIGWATGDWTRDLDRIAVTELQGATQRGVADHFHGRYGRDVEVFKRPAPDACPTCRRLHLGPDGAPRIFKLSELEAHGTNVGKKQAEWQSTIWPIHPRCQCQMYRVPKGWGFDAHGDLSPDGEFGTRYESEEDLELAVRQEFDLQKAIEEDDLIDYQGIPVRVENPKGSVRHWHMPDGQGGETLMQCHYGFIERTEGADGDEIDVFLGPDPRADRVFIVHQQDPLTGTYDEDKIILGAGNAEVAKRIYDAHYDDPGKFLVTMSSMELGQFQRWAAGTQPQVGEMLEGTKDLLVIPLSKADLQREGDGNLLNTVACEQDPAGGRAPGPGLGVNYFIPVPKRKRGKRKVAMAPVIELAKEYPRESGGLHRDKRIYEFPEQLHQVHTLPELNPAREAPELVDPHQVYRNRERANFQIDQDLGRPRNTVEPDDAAIQPVVHRDFP